MMEPYISNKNQMIDCDENCFFSDSSYRSAGFSLDGRLSLWFNALNAVSDCLLRCWKLK